LLRGFSAYFDFVHPLLPQAEEALVDHGVGEGVVEEGEFETSKDLRACQGSVPFYWSVCIENMEWGKIIRSHINLVQCEPTKCFEFIGS